MKIFFDIHSGFPRQGPGTNEMTQKAFEMLPKIDNPRILDVGCGPGMQTVHLAKLSGGEIIAIDLFQEFLNDLDRLAVKEGVADRIETRQMNMFDITLPENSFDILWAEGSIYIYGLEKGLWDWKKFLKEEGYAAVTEVAWIKDDPPKEIYDHWVGMHPSITSVKRNLEIIRECGYELLGHFVLPPETWWVHYYSSIEARLPEMKEKYKDSEVGMKLIEEEELEMHMHRLYQDYFSYVFFVMKK